jgi:hypothetical protein
MEVSLLIPDKHAAAQNIIDSLKNGVVPASGLLSLHTGREKEFQEVLRCLNVVANSDSVVKFVSGEYGSGKTFFMNFFGQHAVDEGFIVSTLQIEKGFRMNSFEDLYYHVMHNLIAGNHTQKSGTSFDEIFNIWIDKLKECTDRGTAAYELNNVISTLNKYNTSFSRAFLSYIRAKINNDSYLSNAASSWITGERNIPYSLKLQFEVKGSIDKQNSFDFLKAFAKDSISINDISVSIERIVSRITFGNDQKLAGLNA